MKKNEDDPPDNNAALALRDTLVALVRRGEPHLTTRELATLLTCYLDEGPHTVRGLAATLNVAKAAITRALDRLERDGLARRAPDPRDRRSVIVERTKGGAKFLFGLRGTGEGAA